MERWAVDDVRAKLRSSPSEKLRSVERPTLVSWKTFVYEDLPLAAAPTAGKQIAFRLPNPPSTALHVAGDWVAVLEGGTAWAATQQQSSSNLLIAEQPGSRKPRAVCSDRGRPDSLRALSIGSFSRDRVDYADFGVTWAAGGTCEGIAKATLEARAVALLPGILYAFRSCVSGCEDGQERVERLSVIGPSAVWAASTVDPASMTMPRHGSFSLLSVEIERGAAASILLHVGWRELAYFMGLHGAAPYWAEPTSIASGQVLSLAVDVVWPEEGPTQALVYASEVTPAASLLLNPSAVTP